MSTMTTIKPSTKVFATVGKDAIAVQFWRLAADREEAWGVHGGKLQNLSALKGYEGLVERKETVYAKRH